MFKSEEERAEIYKNLSKEQIESIEDEYFLDIAFLKKEFSKYNKKVYEYKVDTLVFIVEIE